MWPTILTNVRTAMVPRLPDLQHYKELLLISKSEDDLKKILQVIEDNTAFDMLKLLLEHAKAVANLHFALSFCGRPS
jgi:hypothetical protein